MSTGQTKTRLSGGQKISSKTRLAAGKRKEALIFSSASLRAEGES